MLELKALKIHFLSIFSKFCFLLNDDFKMEIDLKFSFCFKALNSQEKENLNNVYNYSFKLSSHRKRKDPSEIRTPRKNLNFNDALLMQKI